MSAKEDRIKLALQELQAAVADVYESGPRSLKRLEFSEDVGHCVIRVYNDGNGISSWEVRF